jgi:RHS repeat-associated protein
MPALARTTEINCDTRAANEDCINGGSRTRTKYAYDAANELTGLTYTQANGTLIGNLTYTYDVAGHRSSVGGSLAPSSVPTTASTGTYDANNRVTNFNGSTITYDADGNALSDGSNTYIWDARNQLTSLTGPVNGSFKYDAVGRRVQKILGTATTGFLYDGYNLAQEQSATGAATATNLTGGIDEIFARMTSTGISVPLTDALGSVISETNSAAGVTTTFAYEPFGRTTQTGTSSGNSQQFTGRENDGTGVYYYRARYYSPGRGGFISEDPIGFAGGINAYIYADGDPIGMRDPTGLYATPWHGLISLIALLMSGTNPDAAVADMLMDFNPFMPGTQDPANSNWHSMAKPGQSKACAKVGAQNFINSQIASGSTKGLGNALHTSEDSFARSHGYTVWNGHQTGQHLFDDWFPTPDELLYALGADLDIIDSYKNKTNVPGTDSGTVGCGCP